MASDDVTTIAELRNRVRGFVDEREWKQYHNPKDVAISIAIEAAELMEHFQWVPGSELEAITEDRDKIKQIEEELADVMIYCLSFANTMDMDVAQAVTTKIRKNEIKYPIDQVKGNYQKYTELCKDENY